MIDIRKADQRHFTDFGWLKTYWLFSFSSYYDPDNIQFGALRVFNDDVVEPGTGFPTHPHQEMEIITVVLDGEMTHEDSMGNKSIIRKGDVQRMSAGKGLTHSEFNLAEAAVHFYQIWIYPDEKNLDPSYDQKSFSADKWHNILLPIASGQSIKGAVTFHRAATIYRCDLDKGKDVLYSITTGRRIFLYVTKGKVANGETVSETDQARIDIDEPLKIIATESTDFILIDVPSCKGWGYSTETLKGQKE